MKKDKTTRLDTIADLLCEIIIIGFFIFIGYYFSSIIYSRNVVMGIVFIIFYTILLVVSADFKILKLKRIWEEKK
jgi:hypothetical protein